MYDNNVEILVLLQGFYGSF